MRNKYLIMFLLLIILLAGCCKNKQNSINIISGENVSKKEVTDINEFQNMYKDWTNRLIIVSDSTNQAYNSWLSGQISKDEFATKTRELYKETKRLKTEKNYKIVFNLSETDNKQVNYNLVTSSYDKALTQMNDFLRMLPTLEEQDIKTSYNYTNKIVKDEIGKVKKRLAM